jgi:Flp pilus assembly protein TadG
MVEFALLAPFLLLIVVGILQFGIALNNWLDMQRVANQGARWAASNTYPGCDFTSNDAVPCATGAITLQCYLASRKTTENSNSEDFGVNISFPNGTSDVGDPVKVTVSQQFSFLSIVRVPAINISASATMRLAEAAGRYAAGPKGTCP